MASDEAVGGAAGNVGTFASLTVAQAQAAWCKNPKCAGFDFRAGGGFYKGNAVGGFVKSIGYSGYYKPNQIVPPSPPDANAKDIQLNFTMVDLHGSVSVYDIWEQKSLGSFEGTYTAKAVPYHGTAFLRLSTK